MLSFALSEILIVLISTIIVIIVIILAHIAYSSELPIDLSFTTPHNNSLYTYTVVYKGLQIMMIMMIVMIVVSIVMPILMTTICFNQLMITMIEQLYDDHVEALYDYDHLADSDNDDYEYYGEPQCSVVYQHMP